MSTTATKPARKTAARKTTKTAARKTAAKKTTARKTTPKVTTAAPAPKVTTTERMPREGTILAAGLAVLKGKRTPMTPTEIYEEAIARKLYKPSPQAKTPLQSLHARLATANKEGRFVTRPKPGKYLLRK